MSKPATPGEARRWDAPAVDATATAKAAGAALMTVGSVQDLQEEAYREAHAQGVRDGLTSGQQQLHAQIERFGAMLHDLARPFEQLDEQVERELLTLAVALARQIVRRELKTDPTQIIGIIRDAIKALPVTSRDVRVHLHPEDAAIVRQHLAPTESERAWVLVEDPMMGRGGCQVVSASSRVDAQLDARLTAMLAELMGGERSTTPRNPDPEHT